MINIKVISAIYDKKTAAIMAESEASCYGGKSGVKQGCVLSINLNKKKQVFLKTESKERH